MNLGNLFSRLGGFITTVVPSVLKLGEALSLLMTLITVKVAAREQATLKDIALLGQELGELFIEFGGEVAEFFIALGEAVMDGHIDGNEVKRLADEADDIVPIAADFPVKVAALTAKIRGLF